MFQFKPKIAGESGRSMIEMLGVLAVIGVLSIGGIYGYRIAIAKYKANEAAQLVSMAAMEMEVAATTHSQATKKPDLPEDAPVSVSVVDHSGKNNVAIKVDFGDDVRACKQFLQMYQNSSDFAVSSKCEN